MAFVDQTVQALGSGWIRFASFALKPPARSSLLLSYRTGGETTARKPGLLRPWGWERRSEGALSCGGQGSSLFHGSAWNHASAHNLMRVKLLRCFLEKAGLHQLVQLR